MSATKMSATRFRLFAVAAPGFEQILADELRSFAGTSKVKTVSGGVEAWVDAAGLTRVALRTRMAEGLRVRIGGFPAPNLKALEQGLRKLPWRAFVPQGATLQVRTSAKKSRLYHTGAVGQRVERAVCASVKGTAPEQETDDADSDNDDSDKSGSNNTDSAKTFPIFVRLNRNEALVSVDAGRPDFYKRGYRSHIGRAPMRESLAAAVIRAGGIDVARPIWDPFCGAGTFLLEAAAERAGWQRSGRFAFERWPSLAKSAPEVRAQMEQEAFEGAGPPVQHVASDKSRRTLDAAVSNVEAAPFAHEITLVCADFEKAAKSATAGVQIVSNPPYGHRLSGRDAAGLRDLYRRLGVMLRDRTDIERICMATAFEDFESCVKLPFERRLIFQNRGLHVGLWVLERGSQAG